MAKPEFPLVSVIIPVYKVEVYLRQTVESILGQDIGFESHVEIIFVDDGSPDNSGDICLEYKNRYPNNVRYIKQENAGVSAARNRGSQEARGRYIHFLDSDDLIQKNAYSTAIGFLEDNEGIDLATLKVEFFESKQGDHPLNYKFTHDRVIDINLEPNAIVLHVSACIIRRNELVEKFDSSIKISEDMKFLTNFLKKKKKYGAISSARYYYRKRKEASSAIDGARSDVTFYTVTPSRVYQEILDEWTNDGTPHTYAQNVVMYDLQWRLTQEKQTVLDRANEDKYRNLIKSLLCRIDDDVMFAQRHLKSAHLKYALNVKYGGDIPDKVTLRLERFAKKDNKEVILQFIRCKGGSLELEGYVQNNTLSEEVFLYADNEKLTLPHIDNIYAVQTFLGDTVDMRSPFSVTVPRISTVSELKFMSASGKKVKIIPRRRSRLADVPLSYAVFNDSLISNANGSLAIKQYSLLRHVVSEVKWSARIIMSLKLRESAIKFRDNIKSTAKQTIGLKGWIYPVAFPVVTFFRNLNSVGYRLIYHSIAFLQKRDIWIVSDRTIAAGDNGEALYRYIQSQENKSIKVYFAISKDSPDYQRLKNDDVKLLNSDGAWYRLLFLRASKIISSHADDHVINPFSYRLQQFCDLYTFDFIFLQHGIIRNDMSTWLNRYNKDIRLFVTSAKAEYESILEYKYYYDKDRVLLSGLPRYDLLESRPKQKLVLAPTWRHQLAGSLDKYGRKRQYSSGFKKTEYYKFYNSLMNNSTLLKTLRENDMSASLYLHPAFEAQRKDFQQNDIFAIEEFPYDYSTALKEGSLLVTDYSSIFFDFVYLKKPIVYTQFDSFEFYNNQKIYTKGYMDDKKDGFGPVTETLENAISSIVDVINKGCHMDEKYRRRVDSFFVYHDANNSKRVYDAILALDKD